MKSQSVIAALSAMFEGRREDAVSIVSQIAASERHAKRSHVAASLERLIQRRTQFLTPLPDAVPHIDLMESRRQLDSLILSGDVIREITTFIEERRSAEKLLGNDLPIPRTLFLDGEPGNGKTALAESVAAALELPIAIVQYDSLVDSHLGETGKSVGEVFRFTEQHACVLFFDECDSVLQKRGGSSSGGAGKESDRVVNSILQGIDRIGDQSVVAFATNFGDSIDPAVNRRIDTKLTLLPPNQQQLEAFVSSLETRWPMVTNNRSSWFASAIAASNFSECESIVLKAAKQIVLAA